MGHIDHNDKKQREMAFNALGEIVSIAKEMGDPLVKINTKIAAEIEDVMKRQEEIIEEQKERIAIMNEGGWHFSGTPELPGDALYVYVIVWTGYGRTYPLTYCKRNVRGKYVFRYEWINGEIYRGGEITAWKYFPEPPKEDEQ